MKKPWFDGMIVNCSPPGPVQTIYKNVLYDNELSAMARLIHCAIVNSYKIINHCEVTNYCVITNKELADIFEISRSNVSIKISELVKAGYLKSQTIQVIAFPGADYTIAERRLTW